MHPRTPNTPVSPSPFYPRNTLNRPYLPFPWPRPSDPWNFYTPLTPRVKSSSYPFTRPASAKPCGVINERLLVTPAPSHTTMPGRDDSDVSAASSTTIVPEKPTTSMKRKRDTTSLETACTGSSDSGEGYYGGECISLLSEDELPGEKKEGYPVEKQTLRKKLRTATEFRRERGFKPPVRYSTPPAVASLTKKWAVQGVTCREDMEWARKRDVAGEEMVNEIEEGDDEESDEDNDRELTIPGNTSSIVRWCESLSPGPFSSKSESEWSEKSYWSDDLYEGIKSPTNTDSKVELVASDHGAGDVDTKGTPCQGSDSEDDSDGGSSDSTGCQSGCFDFSSNCSSGFSSSSEGGFSSDSDMDSDPGSPQSPIVPASEPPSVSGSEDNENHSDEESITTATSIDRTEFSAVVYNIMLDMGKDHIAWTREALANLQALMEEFAVKEMEALAMICKHRNGDTIEPKDSEMLGKLREMWRMYN